MLFSSPFLVFHSTTVIISSFILTLGSLYTRNPLVLKIQRFLCDAHARRKFVPFCWILSHVGLSGNEKADVLTKMAIQLRPANHNALPLQDYIPPIHHSIRAS